MPNLGEILNIKRWNAIPGYLPDFCRNHIVFLCILAVELLAFLLALVSAEQGEAFWVRLAFISVLAQWISLLSISLMCLYQRYFSRGSNAFKQTMGVLFIVISVAMCTSYMVILLDSWLSFPLIEYSAFSFVIRSTLIAFIAASVLLRYLYMQRQWAEQITAEAHAKVEALQARIRPHFLFNSMNSIASLVRIDPKKAELAIEDLCQLFRGALASAKVWSIEEEIDLARRYLSIEQLRLGERLTVEWDIDPKVDKEHLLPALILQPLVENAVYHGIQPLGEGGTVTIKIERLTAQNSIRFMVKNPYKASATSIKKGNRVAQVNIRQRLQLAYGDASELILMPSAEEYLSSITIPCEGEI